MNLQEEMIKNLTSEEREVLARYSAPAWVFKWFLIFVVTALFVEFMLIFVLFSPEWVQRMQAMNGTFMMTGGLLWAAIVTLIFMGPMKYLAVRGVVTGEKTGKVMCESIERLEKKLDNLKVQEAMENVLARLENIEAAFRRPVVKPALPAEAQAQLDAERAGFHKNRSTTVPSGIPHSS